MECDYCHSDPGTKPTGVWLGFLDRDTNQYVCWGCRKVHYNAKFVTPGNRTYSEFPVVIPPAQLTLRLKSV